MFVWPRGWARRGDYHSWGVFTVIVSVSTCVFTRPRCRADLDGWVWWDAVVVDMCGSARVVVDVCEFGCVLHVFQRGHVTLLIRKGRRRARGG